MPVLIQESSQDLRDIFDPVVNQIIDLVRTQIEDANKEMEHGTINVYIPYLERYLNDSSLCMLTIYSIENHSRWWFRRFRISATSDQKAVWL